MKIDEVITHLGEFGTYQKRVYFLLCLPAITGCMQTLVYVFSLAVPQHRCAIPGMENDTFVIQNPHHASLLNLTLTPHDPCHVVTSRHNGTFWANHSLASNGSISGWKMTSLDYNVTVTSNRGEADESEAGGWQRSDNGDAIATCSAYVYDKSLYKETIATQMDLVCEKKLLPSHAQMFFMLGSLVATITSQPLSDLVGRKKMLMVGLSVHAVSSLAIAWASSFPLLCFFLFASSAANTTNFSNAFTIGMEMVGISKRVWSGYVMDIFWSLGMILLAPMAYFLRHWQHLQIAISILPFAFLSYAWLIPESTRWLLSKGRVSEADAIIQKAARINRVKLPIGALSSESIGTSHKQLSVWTMCRHPVLLLKCFVIFYNWFVCALAFFGLTLSVGNLGGSVYINFLLYGLMELVAYLFCMALLDRVGRRPLNSALMLVAGVACTSTTFTSVYAPPSLQWTTTVLAMVGKLGISGGFATLWVYSSELFPTVARNSGMGVSSFFARIGSVVCPYIANLGSFVEGDFGRGLPLLIFGLCSVVAGLLLLTLPETLRRRLPDTVADVIHLWEGKPADQQEESDADQSEEPLHLRARSKTSENVDC